MLKKMESKDPRHWDKLLPPLMFVYREAPQGYTGFSLFKLLYGNQPRGLLDLIQEGWEAQEELAQSLVYHALQMRERLCLVRVTAQENLRNKQE